MNELETTKSARRVGGEGRRFASRRRGRANPPAHRRLRLEPLEHRMLLSAGDLDPTFGDGGLVTTDFGYMPADNSGRDVVAVQEDGKIVVAGRSYARGSGTRYDFALARYNSDGSLDTSFGGDGKVTTDFGSYDDYAYAVTIDAGGQIVVAGYSYQGDTRSDFALARYNTDGSLDTSFGGDGKVTTDFGSYDDCAYAVTIDAGGQIVVAGNSYQGHPRGGGTGVDFALARYNTDGSLDRTFGEDSDLDGVPDGKVTTDFGSSYNDGAYDVAIDSGGKIVVAGYSYQGGTGNDFALARYNTDGSLDRTFGEDSDLDGVPDGKVTTDFGSASSDTGEGVAIDADGKIVVAGYSYQGSTTYEDFALARYNTDGSLDDGTTSDTTPSDSFGVGGKVTTDFASSYDRAYDLVIDADGKIVAAGHSYEGGVTGWDFAVARYNTDGSLDTTFGEDSDLDGVPDGKVTTDFGSASSDTGEGVAIDADGKIVVAGYSYRSSSGTDHDFALARYNSDGSLDTSFGGDGKVTTDIAKPGTADYGRDLVAVQPDGKIVVAGYSYQGSTTYEDFALARYNTDGSLDTTFGNGGKVTTDFGSCSDLAWGVAIDADGKIVVAGYSRPYYDGTTRWDFAVARYNSDGSLDTSFDGDGKVTTDFGSYDDYAYSVAVDGQGKIVVAGRSYQGDSTGWDFAMARYNTDGSLDTTFGEDSDLDGVPDGKVTTDFISSYGYSYDNAYGVAIDAAGQIVVAGVSYQGSAPEGGTGNDFALARYNTDGSLDTTFGEDSDLDGVPDGKVTTDFGSYSDYAWDVAIDADGKIVAAGYSYQGSAWEGGTENDFALARYNTDGSLDTTFGEDSDLDGVPDGKVTTDFGSSDNDGAYDVAIDSGGKIVVAGCSYHGGTSYDFALARYNTSDGSLDSTFGTGGLVTTDFGSYSDFAWGVAVDGDGKIVVAGYSYQGGTSYDFALARYDADFGVGAITAPTDPAEVNVGITASAVFTDRDVTHTHTAVWDWGDGTNSGGTVDETARTVTGTHSYSAAGVYTVTVTVSAKVDGTVVDSDQSVYQYVVAFDPSAGFVTGAGRLDSPAGAWTAQPWLAGPATFAFVSKYQTGANAPDGNTVFRFRAADLDFRSSSYQWLVVAGAHAKFKGTGTIGGSGDYGFMITATDGQANAGGIDEFRIKIWDSATDTVVYDNKPGEADDSNAGTAISAGNIIVHTGAQDLLAEHSAVGTASGSILTAAAVQPVVDQAIAYWRAAGYRGAELKSLQSVEFHLANFADDRLGAASSSTKIIWLDTDAAGLGWHTGLGSDGAASLPGGFDLLTVVTHELGHALGLDDLTPADHAGHVMAGTLAFGVRRVGLDAKFAPSVLNEPFPVGRRGFETVDRALENDLTGVELLQAYEQLDTSTRPAAWDQEAVDHLLAEADWLSNELTGKTEDDKQAELEEDDLDQPLVEELLAVR